MVDDAAERAMKEVQQVARQLAPESTEEEFLEAFGVGSVCERCGRKGLDDDDYTNCVLVRDKANPDGPWLLFCNECAAAESAVSPVARRADPRVLRVT
jgi:hypothetical protein